MRGSLRALSCFFILLTVSSDSAAQTGMDASGMGSVIVGYDSRTCDGSVEGAIRYNSSTNKVQACLSSGSSCPNVGDTCTDGSVYAGISPDGDIPMYTTPADSPSLLTWNSGNNVQEDTAMENCTDTTPGTAPSCQTGEANTIFLIGATGEPDYPFDAAVYCYGLSVYEHEDWYLPAQDELNVLYTNKNIGNLNGTFDESGIFPSGWYKASSEYSSHASTLQNFDDGTQSFAGKHGTASVRCVRKSSTPPAGYSWTSWGE